MDSREPATAAEAMRTFQVGPCLGKGGFGEVYHAIMDRPGGLRTEVALKVLHEGLSPQSQAVERLRDEGRLLGLLRHPAIVRVLDLVVLEGRVALVSEYIEGVDLHRVRGELPITAALEVIGTVADALDAAWQQLGPDGKELGLVHRDVKPANIRLGRHGEVKLLDFGIAKAQVQERDANTSTGMVLGSMPYLAPERLAGTSVGPPGDIHALGSTLWECLAGRRLMSGVDVPDQVRMALDPAEYADFIEDRLDELAAPKPVTTLLRWMLAREPDERPTAFVVAGQCDKVAGELEGEGLRAWARSWTWPSAAAEHGPLTGRTLTDGFTVAHDSIAAPPEASPADTIDVHQHELTPTAPRRPVGLFVLGIAGLIVAGGLVCLGIGGGAIAVRQSFAPSGVGAAAGAAQAGSAAPAGGVEPASTGEHVPGPEVATAPGVDTTPKVDATPKADTTPKADATPKVRPGTVSPRPSATAPAPAASIPSDGGPAPTPATMGRIEVAGSLVPEIRLGRRRISPGQVTAGTYTLWYDFGEGLKQAGTIEVGAGQTVTVQCNRLRYDCSSR